MRAVPSELMPEFLACTQHVEMKGFELRLYGEHCFLKNASGVWMQCMGSAAQILNALEMLEPEEYGDYFTYSKLVSYEILSGNVFTKEKISIILQNVKPIKCSLHCRFRRMLLNAYGNYQEAWKQQNDSMPRSKQDKLLQNIAKTAQKLEGLFQQLDNDVFASDRLEHGFNGIRHHYKHDKDLDVNLFWEELHIMNYQAMQKLLHYISHAAQYGAKEVPPCVEMYKNAEIKKPAARLIFEVGRFWKEHFSTPFTAQRIDGIISGEAIDVLQQVFALIDPDVSRETIYYHMYDGGVIQTINNNKVIYNFRKTNSRIKTLK